MRFEIVQVRLRLKAETVATSVRRSLTDRSRLAVLAEARASDYRNPHAATECHVGAGSQGEIFPMRFIEMTGEQLMSVLSENEATPQELKAAGLTEQCLVRINQQGDIEVRRRDGWDVIGGLIGEFEKRIKKASGRDWA
jgi:hypothetical protein